MAISPPPIPPLMVDAARDTIWSWAARVRNAKTTPTKLRLLAGALASACDLQNNLESIDPALAEEVLALCRRMAVKIQEG